jgi:hypothetical protein
MIDPVPAGSTSTSPYLNAQVSPVPVRNLYAHLPLLKRPRQVPPVPAGSTCSTPTSPYLKGPGLTGACLQAPLHPAPPPTSKARVSPVPAGPTPTSPYFKGLGPTGACSPYVLPTSASPYFKGSGLSGAVPAGPTSASPT